jgi:hypothetical protein
MPSFDLVLFSFMIIFTAGEEYSSKEEQDWKREVQYAAAACADGDDQLLLLMSAGLHYHTKAPFGCQNFWQNTTVAFSLLFVKYCPIMV